LQYSPSPDYPPRAIVGIFSCAIFFGFHVEKPFLSVAVRLYGYLMDIILGCRLLDEACSLYTADHDVETPIQLGGAIAFGGK